MDHEVDHSSYSAPSLRMHGAVTPFPHTPLWLTERFTFYKFLSITNLTQFFMYLFISSLYMFRASQCPSSGDRIHHLVRLVCVTAWYAGQEGTHDRHTKQSLTKINHTR